MSDFTIISILLLTIAISITRCVNVLRDIYRKLTEIECDTARIRRELKKEDDDYYPIGDIDGRLKRSNWEENDEEKGN